MFAVRHTVLAVGRPQWGDDPEQVVNKDSVLPQRSVRDQRQIIKRVMINAEKV
jgi:hypothetical protein